MTRTKVARNAAIVRRVLVEGESVDETAVAYGISAVRVRQIIRAHVPVGTRDVADVAVNKLINERLLRLRDHLSEAAAEVSHISILRTRLSSAETDKQLADPKERGSRE